MRVRTSPEKNRPLRGGADPLVSLIRTSASCAPRSSIAWIGIPAQVAIVPGRRGFELTAKISEAGEAGSSGDDATCHPAGYAMEKPASCSRALTHPPTGPTVLAGMGVGAGPPPVHAPTTNARITTRTCRIELWTDGGCPWFPSGQARFSRPGGRRLSFPTGGDSRPNVRLDVNPSYNQGRLSLRKPKERQIIGDAITRATLRSSRRRHSPRQVSRRPTHQFRTANPWYSFRTGGLESAHRAKARRLPKARPDG